MVLLAVVVVPLATTSGAVNVPPIETDDASCVRSVPLPLVVPLLVKPTPFKVNVLLPLKVNVPPPLTVKFVTVVLPLPKVTSLIKVVVEPLKIVIPPLINEPVPDRF